MQTAPNNNDLGSELGKAFDPTTLGTDIANNIINLNKLATELNGTFGQTRQRISDVVEEIGKSTPELTRLGGGAKDAAKVIEDVALATRRNVVASNETIKELYATSKVIGQEVSTIVEDFTDVGIQFENVQENLIQGVNYVQSVGMNTKQVMEEVVQNADMLNKFNFDGGVLGLTKMAAQSAMLRVNMRDTAQFADKAMDPEGAIKLSSAFQRLGVNMGTLSDPFALMNASINDPQGLQKSIAQMAERYTVFDEKTKSFKIDPQGIRFLREISKETGISYDNLSKMGLALANNDKIMGQMKYGANLSEEEKQYIASMAQMNEGGEYTIKVRDEQGKEVNRKLTELSEAQLKTAIEAQKNAPKSMEDIARAQMQTSDVIAGDVNAIRQKVVQGISVAQPLRDLPEQTRALTTAATDAIVKLIPNADKIQGGTEKAISYLKDTIQDVVTGKKSFESVAGEMKSGLKSMGYDVVGVFEKVPEVLTQSVTKNLQGKQDPFSKEAYQALTTGKGQEKFQDILKQYTSSQGLTKQIEQTKKTSGATEKKEVTHTGNININVDLQGDFNDPETEKKWQKMMDDQRFKDYLVKTVTGSKDATGQTIQMKIK
jgi:uncharacterized protein (DUF302 family)